MSDLQSLMQQVAHYRQRNRELQAEVERLRAENANYRANAHKL
jgi:phage shock protein A